MISKAEIKLIKSLEYKKFRDAEGLFVAEGPKVVGELQKRFECVKLFDDADDVHKASFLKNPQGILGIFKIPSKTDGATSDKDNISAHLSLLLDCIQDPGNLGTIIRIADWFGIDNIFCSADTADCWSPKVVQATMGSLARVNVTYCNLVELIDQYPSVPVYGTFLDGKSLYKQELSETGFIVMGNEGKGISAALAEKINHRLLIPSSREGAESLNVAVATAVTLAEFRRQTASCKV